MEYSPHSQLNLVDMCHLVCRHFQLALLLLREAKKGAQSLWYPYIQHLPNSFHTLVHWSNSELEALQYGDTESEQKFLLEVARL